MIKQEGYSNFGMHQHTLLWKKLGTKQPSKGYGVLVANTWYWYERWVDEVRKHCIASADIYTTDSKKGTEA